MRVLVVDDQDDMRAVIRRALELEGHEVFDAVDGGEMRAAMEMGCIDVVVLDVHLPGPSGLDLVREMRAASRGAHVILVSADADVAARVLGLGAGADDYLGKPFSTEELVARVAASARRLDMAAGTLTVGDLTIDGTARSATMRGVRLDLTRREFDLLHHLARYAGRTFTREELLRAVWTSSSNWQQAATVTEHIRRLRIKIERDLNVPEYLVTIRSVGYRLAAPSDGQERAALDVPTSADAILIVVGTTIVAANDTAAALLGASDRSQVVGRDGFDFVAARSRAATAARLAQVRTGRVPRPQRMVVNRLDGAEVSVEMASTPITWGGRPATQATLWPVKETGGNRQR